MASQIWSMLKARFIGADRVKKARLATLKNEFQAMTMKYGDSIDEFVGKITAISSRACDLGETYEDKVLVQKLLNSVPERFIQIVASIEQFVDLDTMLFQEAIGRLKTFEERTDLKKRQSSASSSNGKEDQLLLTYSEWQDRKKELKSKNKNWGKGDQSMKSDLKRKEEKSKTQKFGSRKRIDKSKVVPSRYDAETEWYLDNGASNHMPGSISMFSYLDKNVSGNVKFGDGSCVKIEGRGTIVLDGRIVTRDCSQMCIICHI
ncbi:uncharacterized protein LOC143624267 [Bidens hawaiensis]|uniref:uncharacterized protein LOC143624267 n=1 Tax=Bidens hawaiensis TaxID=980011 RepID=UPI00404A40FD